MRCNRLNSWRALAGVSLGKEKTGAVVVFMRRRVLAHEMEVMAFNA
jgi:hypothetical protein